MIDMEPKDAIKLDNIPLTKKIRKKPYYPKMNCVSFF